MRRTMNSIGRKPHIFTLLFVAILASCSGEKTQLTEIPGSFRGLWKSEDGHIWVGKTHLTHGGGYAHQCEIESITLTKRYGSAQPYSLHIRCDRRSTAAAQMRAQELGIPTPEDYRKSYTFKLEDSLDDMDVSHSMFILKGFGSAENETFELGRYSKTRY